MKHEISNYTSVAGLLVFVICVVVSVRVTQVVDADRAARYEACRKTGEAKITCSIRSVFGGANYEN